MQEQTKSIVATNLWDMLVEVQAAVKQGYVLSDENQYYPQSFIGLYTCTMVYNAQVEIKVDSDGNGVEDVISAINKATAILKESSTEPSVAITGKEVQAKKPVGRKPKSN